ncbi:hypothetical protein [Streptomyces vilmorinianum]|uniref:hypothetical protein n=1 Tax=Streptomyces vilmorinianum TaxID=3051092 RepID=UPI0010FB099F|nr:hypothetical protein [Streptomyces vilmorinianum]
MNLRMIGLGAVVACATLLPLVALAGPAAGPGAGPGSGAVPGTASGEDAKPQGDGGLLPGLGLGEAPAPPAPAPTSLPSAAVAPPSSPSPSTSSTSALPGRTSHCGPELTSPDGIEAQTCVLTEGPDTWARTYYRNATGQRLDSVLTLMAPGGRTVQVRCSVTAHDEPGACETPRERGRGDASAYSAVAEFAGAGEGASTPLLLRAGSNTAVAGGS